MKYVTDVASMRASDAACIAAGTPAGELIRRAAKAIFDAYEWHGVCAVACGSGNNGADGYALALLLHDAGFICRLIRLTNRFSPDGEPFYRECLAKGIPDELFSDATDFSGDDVIADCIFGTGFSGEVTTDAEKLIRAINESGKEVVSADLNSGLCGDSGIGKTAVRSDVTVSVGTPKIGHFLGDAKDLIGKLVVADVGIPPVGNLYGLAEPGDFADLFPPRKQNSHKGNYGYVTLLGGCREYSGAVRLANLSQAALRSGCGVAQLAVPESIVPSVAPHLLESTVAPIPDTEGHMRFLPEVLDRVLSRQSALAIGMGWGKNAENAKISEYILKNFALPVVIDADGLNTLAGMGCGILKETECDVLLTPHLKEMERLCNVPAGKIAADPVSLAREFASEYGVTVLLKGPATVITDGKETVLVDRGCAGMATAGSGDVLSGILVGLLGSRPLSVHVAACGAMIAGLAGSYAAAEKTETAMLASDTVAHIPDALREILRG